MAEQTNTPFQIPHHFGQTLQTATAIACVGIACSLATLAGVHTPRVQLQYDEFQDQAQEQERTQQSTDIVNLAGNACIAIPIVFFLASPRGEHVGSGLFMPACSLAAFMTYTAVKFSCDRNLRNHTKEIIRYVFSNAWNSVMRTADDE